MARTIYRISMRHQSDVGIFTLEPVELLAGSRPQKQRRLVEAWAELRRDELIAAWNRLQQGRSPLPIEPLR